MTLEKHVIDTMKEWQIKMGSLDSDIRLYYPKTSLCRYLNLQDGIENDVLGKCIEKYFADKAEYLGEISVSAAKDRFCILVGKEGCNYVEKNVPEPEFLAKFLEVLKSRKMQTILDFFEEYAKENETTVCIEQEEGGMETILYFENEEIEPYVYCIDQNEFGISYHRFSKGDYEELHV